MAGYDKRRFMINAIYDEDAKRYKDSTLSSHALFQKYRKMEQGCETSLSDRVEGGKLESASSSKAELDHAAVKEEEKVSAPPLIGRSFAETFAYLKNTDHYKEATESVQTSAQSKRSNCIVVNSRQRGNPILKHVRNVPWEYGEIIPDYEIGLTSCALFLSLRYHNLNPEYIHERLKQLGSRYILRVLLVMVDVNDSRHSLNELGKIAIRTDCTLLLAWSAEEAGRYLETYKSFENKPPDVLQEKVESDYLSKMQDCLTSIKSVNKSDVITLISTFGSLDKLVVASKDEIALCPGIGPLKAERLIKAFYEPFKRHRKASTDPKKAVTSHDSGGSEGFESKPESGP